MVSSYISLKDGRMPKGHRYFREAALKQEATLAQCTDFIDHDRTACRYYDVKVRPLIARLLDWDVSTDGMANPSLHMSFWRPFGLSVDCTKPDFRECYVSVCIYV